MKHFPPLILASQSPRRRELLAQANYDFVVMPPSADAEDGQREGETPLELVARLARQKAADVARQVDRGTILGCDTVAECGGKVLGKPRDLQDARDMLWLLRGRDHHVISGLCLWQRPADSIRIATDVTSLRMDEIASSEIERYLDSGEWEGKAGAFGYQDRLGWIHVVDGSESNVVGLPLELLAAMLNSLDD